MTALSKWLLSYAVYVPAGQYWSFGNVVMEGASPAEALLAFRDAAERANRDERAAGRGASYCEEGAVLINAWPLTHKQAKKLEGRL